MVRFPTSGGEGEDPLFWFGSKMCPPLEAKHILCELQILWISKLNLLFWPSVSNCVGAYFKRYGVAETSCDE